MAEGEWGPVQLSQQASCSCMLYQGLLWPCCCSNSLRAAMTTYSAQQCLLDAPKGPQGTFIIFLMLQVTAARCGANPADVLAALHATSGAASSAQPAVSARSGKSAGAAELQLVPGLVPFSMGRTFSPREGAAYAVAAAAQAGAGSPTDAPQDLTAGLAVELEGDEAGEAAPGSSRLVGGRVVGRHRLNQRLLVVGFNQLPGGWEPGQPLQPASAGGSGSKHAAEQRSTAAADNQEAHQLAQQVAGAEAVATPEAHGSVVDSISGSMISIGEDLLLPSWAVTGSAAGSSEGAGLGTSRYTLPPVASDTATHLLQFDGASRGNPGGTAGGVAVTAAKTSCAQ